MLDTFFYYLKQECCIIYFYFKHLLLLLLSLQKLEEKFRLGRRELIAFEFTILVALEMALYLPDSKVMPHYRRLTQGSS